MILKGGGILWGSLVSFDIALFHGRPYLWKEMEALSAKSCLGTNTPPPP